MLAMMNPAFKKALQDQGIILTTWREVKNRRDRVHWQMEPVRWS